MGPKVTREVFAKGIEHREGKWHIHYVSSKGLCARYNGMSFLWPDCQFTSWSMHRRMCARSMSFMGPSISRVIICLAGNSKEL